MFSKHLAKMILEHGADLVPYLKLRAMYELQNQPLQIKVPLRDMTLAEIKAITISGLAELVSNSEDTAIVAITSDNRYMGFPIESEKAAPTIEEPKIPYGLTKLVEILGYPIDWEKNTNKYSIIYYSRVKKYDLKEMVQVAEWAVNNQEKISLNALFTEAWYASLKHKMEHRPKILDRVSSSNYDDEEALLAAEREFLGNADRAI